MTKEELEEIEDEFGFSLQKKNKFIKPLSAITKEEYRGLMQSIFEQVFNDDSKEEEENDS